MGRLLALGLLGGGGPREINTLCPAIAPTLGTEMWDPDAAIFTDGTYTWWVYGTNTLANDANTLKLAFVDNTNGGGVLLRNTGDLNADLTVGTYYQFKFDLKVNAGSSVQLRLSDGITSHYLKDETGQSFVTTTTTFRGVHTTGGSFAISSLGAGEIAWVDNLSLRPLANLGVYLGTRPVQAGWYTCAPVVADHSQCGLDILYKDPLNFARVVVDRLGSPDTVKVLTCTNGIYALVANANGAITYGAGRELKTVIAADGTVSLYYNNVKIGTDGLITLANFGQDVYGFNTLAGNTVGAVTTVPIYPIVAARAAKIPTGPVAWEVLVNPLPAGRYFNDVTPNGTILVNNNYGSILASTDEGANWSTIAYNPGVANDFPSSLQAIKYMPDGHLLVTTQDSKIYRSNNTAWDNGFTLVHAMSVGVSGPQFGLDYYHNIVLACEYAAPAGDHVYGSQDYGATWSLIFTAPAGLPGNHHCHNAIYDPYEGIVWIVTGDGANNRMVYYSRNFGATWTQLATLNTFPEQMINVVPLPECILFGTDDPTVGFYRIMRRQGASTYHMIELEQAWLAWPTEALNSLPWASRPVVVYGDDACAYVSFQYFYDTQTGLGDIYATYDGTVFTKIAESAVAPVGTNLTLGVVVMAGPTDAGYIYFSFNVSNEVRQLVKIAVPTWS
jgi:hypothetical protein